MSNRPVQVGDLVEVAGLDAIFEVSKICDNGNVKCCVAGTGGDGRKYAPEMLTKVKARYLAIELNRCMVREAQMNAKLEAIKTAVSVPRRSMFLNTYGNYGTPT